MNLGDHHLGQAAPRLSGATLLGDQRLRRTVRQNQRHVLALDARRQAVLVVVPEQLEQLLVRNDGWIVVDGDHLGVVAATWQRQWETEITGIVLLHKITSIMLI